MNDKIDDHILFWNNERGKKVLVSYRLGNNFFATHYKAAKPLLVQGKRIVPEMLDVDAFMEDYERQYEEITRLGQSALWTAEAYPAIPWMEAFFGCDIIAQEESFTAMPFIKDTSELDKLKFDMENPWVKKFFEFTIKLNKLSNERFPVGAPILRGQGDTMGALLGQAEFIYAMYEEEELVRRSLDKITTSFLQIYSELHKQVTVKNKALGFYHIYTPTEGLWFQDDIGALLSPEFYRNFILPNEKIICSEYEYNLVHLHPSAFHLLNDILSNDELKAVQINKDLAGPSIKEMLPQMEKVFLSGRPLVIWGDLSIEDIRLCYSSFDELSPGLFFNIVKNNFKSAKEFNLQLESI